MTINRVAISLVSMTEEVRILNFLANHIIIIHNHRLIIGENRNHINSKPNKAKSINAVTFASAANPKNNQAIITYFSISFLSLELFLFWRKIKPANKASKDRAITHKSVLLSTITRNAHIQPVNHNKRKYHHIVIQFWFETQGSVIVFFDFFKLDFLPSVSSSFLFIKVNTWNIIAIQKIRTKVVLILFIEMAILSGDNPNHQLVHPVKEKIKVKNWCQNHGILFAT